MNVRTVRLRNGEDVAEPLVTPVTLSLRLLMESDPVALYELVAACRDRSHRLYSGCAQRLAGLALVEFVAKDGQTVVNDSTRAIVLSATEGDWDSLHLVSPFAAGGAS